MANKGFAIRFKRIAAALLALAAVLFSYAVSAADYLYITSTRPGVKVKVIGSNGWQYTLETADVGDEAELKNSGALSFLSGIQEPSIAFIVEQLPEGYEFDGWYQVKSGTVGIPTLEDQFEHVWSAGNITVGKPRDYIRMTWLRDGEFYFPLMLKLKPVTHNVDYFAVGANGTMYVTSTTSTAAATLILPKPSLSNPGFVCDDTWYSDEACTKAFGNAGDSFTPTEDLELYCKYSIVTPYSVKTEAVNCSITAPSEGAYGEALTVTWAPSSESGYTFEFEFAEIITNGVAAIRAESDTRSLTFLPDGDDFEQVKIRVFYNKRPNVYQLTFMDGLTRIAMREVTFGEPIGNLPHRADKDGNKFVGWFDETGAKLESTTRYATIGDRTVRARWSSLDEVGELSKAVGCWNSVLTSNGEYVEDPPVSISPWQPREEGGVISGTISGEGTWVWDTSTMKAVISGVGTLTFDWQRFGNSDGFADFQVNGGGNVNASAKRTRVFRSFIDSSIHTCEWRESKGYNGSGATLVVYSVRWYPEMTEEEVMALYDSIVEPTAADAPTIGADATFVASEQFDYIIWSAPTLNASTWTERARVVGEGYPVEIPIAEDMSSGERPQQFYKVEVIKREL